VKSAQATVPAPAPTASGGECPRCGALLRPDWNFCPTCSIPARPGKEVLSNQIQVLRTAAPANAPTSAPVRWALSLAAVALVFATGAVGWFVLSPRGASLILPPGTEEVKPTADPGDALRLDWVLVPAGNFGFGPPTEGRPWREEVFVPAFEILRTEISNAQWRQYLLARRDYLRSTGAWESSVPSYWTWSPDPEDPAGKRMLPGFPWTDASLPVRNVSFLMAEDFCAWLDATGQAPGARLPREEEWEKAARGTDGRTYPWGDEPLAQDVSMVGRTVTGNRAVVNSNTGPMAVYQSSSDVSAYQVLHMGGNVSEWTDHPAWKAGLEPGDWKRYHVIRGASWQETTEDGVYSARTWNDDFVYEARITSPLVGFRIARDAPAAGGAAPGSSKEAGGPGKR